MMSFALNLLLAFLWTVLFQNFNVGSLVVGFIIGFGILALLDQSYGRRGIYLAIFLVNLVWQVIVSSIELAWTLVKPNMDLHPGIVAIPLDLTSDFQIATLASAITLTPGTLSVDVGSDRETGERLLFVHTLFLTDPDQLREQIKNGFERHILMITK